MQDAKQDAYGCSNGPGSQQSGQHGLLVVKAPNGLSYAQAEAMRKVLGSTAKEVGMKVLLLQDGMDATVVPAGMADLVAVMRAQTEAISRLAASNEALVQAMAEAEGVEPWDVPATVGLNGRAL